MQATPYMWRSRVFFCPSILDWSVFYLASKSLKQRVDWIVFFNFGTEVYSRSESYFGEHYLCLGYLKEYFILSKIIDQNSYYTFIPVLSILMYSLFQEYNKTYN
jgi:hypothetical protein